jgi:hypothetical protein
VIQGTPAPSDSQRSALDFLSSDQITAWLNGTLQGS